MFEDKLRVWALIIICKSYGNILSLGVLKALLSMRASSDQEMLKFLEEDLKLTVDRQKSGLVLKGSREALLKNPLSKNNFI